MVVIETPRLRPSKIIQHHRSSMNNDALDTIFQILYLILHDIAIQYKRHLLSFHSCDINCHTNPLPGRVRYKTTEDVSLLETALNNSMKLVLWKFQKLKYHNLDRAGRKRSCLDHWHTGTYISPLNLKNAQARRYIGSRVDGKRR